MNFTVAITEMFPQILWELLADLWDPWSILWEPLSCTETPVNSTVEEYSWHITGVLELNCNMVITKLFASRMKK